VSSVEQAWKLSDQLKIATCLDLKELEKIHKNPKEYVIQENNGTWRSFLYQRHTNMRRVMPQLQIANWLIKYKVPVEKVIKIPFTKLLLIAREIVEPSDELFDDLNNVGRYYNDLVDKYGKKKKENKKTKSER